MTRLSETQPQPTDPTLIEGEPRPDFEAPRDEPLEEWLIHPDNVRRFGFYLGAFIAVAAIAWVATRFGAPGWAAIAAGAVMALGLGFVVITRAWRRTWVSVGAAIGVLALATGIWITLGAFGVGPAASLRAAGTLHPNERVVVREFRGDSVLGRAMATALRVALAESQTMRVIETESPGARTSIEGDVRRVGDGLALSLRLVRGRHPLAEFHEVADSPDELIARTDALARALRRKAGDPLREIRATPHLDRVLTPSLDALVLYSAALSATAGARPAQAIPMLRNAVALDTGFALARLKLADLFLVTAAAQDSVDSALDGAARFRDRLLASARLQLDASYFSYSTHRDRARAIAAMSALLAHGDTTAGTLNGLAGLFLDRRAYARAESLSAAAVVRGPGTTAFHDNLFAALAAQSRMTRLEMAVRDLQRQLPGDSRALAAPALLLYANGDYDAALALADSLRTSIDTKTREFARVFVARLELLHGHVGAFERFIRDSAAARASASAHALADSALLSLLDAWYLGQNERAARRLDSTLAALPLSATTGEERIAFQVARVYAMAGKPDRARAVIEQNTHAGASALARQSQPGLHRTLGEIALAEGRPKLAIVEFYRADSLPDGPTGDPLQTMVDLGRAFNDANEPDSAIVWLERFVNAPRWRRDSLDAIYLPRVHELLAELYDTKGDGARAMSHYGRFVNLWRGADTELLPIVASARTRFTELERETR